MPAHELWQVPELAVMLAPKTKVVPGMYPEVANVAQRSAPETAPLYVAPVFVILTRKPIAV